jgi:hypothetical protein
MFPAHTPADMLGSTKVLQTVALPVNVKTVNVWLLLLEME